MKTMITMSMKDCEVYLRGLRRFVEMGVNILVDGVVSDSESEWKRILTEDEESTFYMGDYIEDEEGILREIHFNKMIY